MRVPSTSRDAIERLASSWASPEMGNAARDATGDVCELIARQSEAYVGERRCMRSNGGFSPSSIDG